MTKKRTIAVFACVVLVLCFIAFLWVICSVGDVASFSLEDFSDEIQMHPSDRSVGEVATASQMKTKSLEVLTDVYGYDVYFRFPFCVYFDEENQAWLMRGSFFFEESGPCIIISKADGKVLAVWDYKF